MTTTTDQPYLHDVLAVDPVGHEGHRPGVAVLVCSRANTANRRVKENVGESRCVEELVDVSEG